VPARPPLTAHMQRTCETLRSARVNPMGKRLHVSTNERYKPLVEVDLLARGHLALHPRSTYYNE